MSKFVIECPVCHRYTEGATGLFAKKKIPCVCGNVIDLRTDRQASRVCMVCGNTVVYDQALGESAHCPVCQAPLITRQSTHVLVDFRCATCGCDLRADRTAAKCVCPVCAAVNDVQKQIRLLAQKREGRPVVIAFEDDGEAVVWKHPLMDFVTGSQLIVHETQEAIFFRNGKALDSFRAGRYTLETGVLSKMDADGLLPRSGGQPFRAEVYFVSLVTQMGIKWGTNSKVSLFDPICGLYVQLGASGTFNLRVTQPRKLLLKLVGTSDELTREQLCGHFRMLVMDKVKANLARIIKENQISVLGVDERLEQVSRGLMEVINADLSEYGLQMPEFYVARIVTPEDDANFCRMKQQYADRYRPAREAERHEAQDDAQ